MVADSGQASSHAPGPVLAGVPVRVTAGATSPVPLGGAPCAPAAEGASYPKRRRIRKRRDFLRVQERTDVPRPAEGSAQRQAGAPGHRATARVTTPHFVLLVARQPAPGPCRLGIVASKKIGGAVVRNRAKRLLREAFRTHASLFPADVDLVVIARPGASDLTFFAVCGELEGVAGILARRASDVLRK